MATIFGFLYMGCTLAPPEEYEWTVHVRWRCGLMSNYFDHLLLFIPRSLPWRCTVKIATVANMSLRNHVPSKHLTTELQTVSATHFKLRSHRIRCRAALHAACCVIFAATLRNAQAQIRL